MELINLKKNGRINDFAALTLLITIGVNMKNLKNKIAILISATFISLITISSHADVLYNYYSGEWELGNSNDTLQYNYYENEWSYEQPGSSLEYNYYENEWGFTN